ncbi:MAG: hypothetical protein WC450_09375 [Candidatus Omnitrophota bacterium]|jgi:hypothetical protein
MGQLHICGQCNAKFKTEAEYLAHLCKKTGHKPTEIENLGPEAEAISKAALERGAARKK